MSIRQRLDGLDWGALERMLWESGSAKTPIVLSAEECAKAVAWHARPELFRSHIDMARYRFGVGDYHYFADPLPELVRDLRRAAYPHIAPIANRWMEALGMAERYPP